MSEPFVSDNPGRDAQRVGTAGFLGQPVEKIHDWVWAVVGTLGDSQCYLGVQAKVGAIFEAMSEQIRRDDMPVRLIAPAYTLGVSDGQLNGTDRMRYSLIGRELVNDATDVHLRANDVAGFVAVVACDKPPIGTLAAILEYNVPAVILSDGTIKPGHDPETGAPLDIISGFQVAGDPDDALRTRVALHACPGQGSCGGMFTYNTMQTFIGVLGMEPLHMVSPTSDDSRRLTEFPDQLIDCIRTMSDKGIRPRDIVTPASIRNALTVAMAMGGSTNVALHSVEIARAAGIDLWQEVMSQAEFNELSHRLPVLVDMRPFGKYAMQDLDGVGGVAVVVKELLDGGWLDGSTLTCTGETLAEQVARLAPPAPDGTVVYPLSAPFKPTGGLRLLRGNLAPEGGAILKLAGVEGGIVDNRFVGTARVFDSEALLIAALEQEPDSFQDNSMVVIRYEGPRGAPGMPEMLDPTSRITTLCRQRGITIALMTDARFSGGSVGLVIGHIGPEAYLGGPIALIENGDTIVVDLNDDTLTCTELADAATFGARAAGWNAAVEGNGGVHPDAGVVSSRVLSRIRATASPALPRRRHGVVVTSLLRRRVALAMRSRLFRRSAPICDDVSAWALSHGTQVTGLLAPRTLQRSLPNTLEVDIDDAYGSRLVANRRGRYLVPVQGARLVGPHGLVALPDGSFASETAYGREVLMSEPAYHELGRRPIVRKPGSYFSLVVSWSARGNYYHWLHDTLTRLYGVGEHLPEDVRFVVPANLADFQRESLKAFELPEHQLDYFDGSEEWRLETLYFAPPVTNSGSDRGDVDRWLRSKLLAAAGVREAVPTRRLYLTRSSAFARRVTNDHEVEAVLGAHGFESCMSDALSFLEEVSTFSQAACVISPHGAGLANTLFAPPGLKVLDIVPRHKLADAYVYWTMAQELGHEYWYLVADSVDAPNANEPDMYIPCDKLAATLERMLG